MLQQRAEIDSYDFLGSRRERKRRRRRPWGGRHRWRREDSREADLAPAAQVEDVVTADEASVATAEVRQSVDETAAAAAPERSLWPDRQALLDLLDDLDAADAYAAYRFLSYLHAGSREADEPRPYRVYGDIGGRGAQRQKLEPLIILVGPCAGIASIDGLIREIDEAPHLEVGFRLFRDGFYRVDGHTDDRTEVGTWLSARTGVQSVVDDGTALHVRPRPEPAP